MPKLYHRLLIIRITKKGYESVTEVEDAQYEPFKPKLEALKRRFKKEYVKAQKYKKR